VLATQETRPARKVTINLSELVARTAGYHDGLNEMEAALLQLGQPERDENDLWQDLALAQRSLDQFRQLIDDYRFIQLYYHLLTVEQRQRVAAPQSPARLCERFLQSLDRWNGPRKGDYLRSFRRDLPESQQAVLQALRNDLAALATRIGNE